MARKFILGIFNVCSVDVLELEPFPELFVSLKLLQNNRKASSPRALSSHSQRDKTSFNVESVEASHDTRHQTHDEHRSMLTIASCLTPANKMAK